MWTQRVGATLAVAPCRRAAGKTRGTTARVAPTRTWCCKPVNVPYVSQSYEIPTQNTAPWYILPNLCFARKKAMDFVIFPEFVLDNGGGVWYHIDVR